MRTRRLLLVAATAAGLAAASVASAAWEPPGWRVPSEPEPNRPTNPAAMALSWAVRGYQETASRVDGDRCPSYPTCSHYALEAVKKHGPLVGIVLTAGRLISEGDEAAFAPRIHVAGQWRIYSPVEDDLAFLGRRLDP